MLGVHRGILATDECAARSYPERLSDLGFSDAGLLPHFMRHNAEFRPFLHAPLIARNLPRDLLTGARSSFKCALSQIILPVY